MCQIWTAMVAILLLQYLKNKAKYDWHMYNLVTFIRIYAKRQYKIDKGNAAR